MLLGSSSKKVGEEEEIEIKGTVGVKQGDNLGSILFIFLIQAVSTTLDKKQNFATPDFRRYTLKLDGGVKVLGSSKDHSN